LIFVKGLERIYNGVNVSLTSTNIEHDLVSRALIGDRGAFCSLVREHRAGVINVVYRMCGDSHLAEDAAQEAFVRAWQNLDKFKPKSSFRNWLYRIATNVAIDILRMDRDEMDIETVPIVSKMVGPEKAVEESQRSEMVKRAVLSLPPASRSVLVLREYEGLSYREIGETLGIPTGTVMSRLNYGRNLLREQLSPLLEEK
jgi:RNA polymerase sigma-70 factor (ECF subfamily)